MVKRFCHIISAAKFKPFNLIFRLAFCGEEYDGNIGRFLAGLQLGANIIAVLFGHHDVQQDQVRHFSKCRFYGLFPIFSLQKGVTFLF